MEGIKKTNCLLIAIRFRMPYNALDVFNNVWSVNVILLRVDYDISAVKSYKLVTIIVKNVT